MNQTLKIAAGVTIGIVVAVLILALPRALSETTSGRSCQEMAHEVACRSNLRSLGSAEAMFYRVENRYGTIDELASSGVRDNASRLTCPTCGRGYSAIISDGGDSYRIGCPGYGSENHGSIEDGRVSW